MTIPLNSTDTTSQRAAMPPVAVYVRRRWSDRWEEIAGLYCDTLTLCVSPEISRAAFSWRYGVGRLPHEDRHARIDKQDLLDWYVKIEIGDPDLDDPILVDDDVIRWCGVFTEQSAQEDGELDWQPPREPGQPGQPARERVPSGRQTFTALGLEHLLDRCYWDGSVSEGPPVEEEDEEPPTDEEEDDEPPADGEEPPAEDTPAPREERWTARPLGFNSPHGYAAPGDRPFGGDRSLQPGPHGAYVFAYDLAEALPWSTSDAVRYLLTYHAPRAMDGSESLRLAVDEEVWGQLPTWDRPIVSCDSDRDPSLKTLLDQLLDRRRMFAWWMDVQTIPGSEGQDPQTGEPIVEPDTDVLVLRVATLVDEPLALSSTVTIPANPHLVRLDFARALDVEHALVAESARGRVDRVVVRGAPLRSVGTLWRGNTCLVRGWTPEDQAAYKAGPPGLSSAAFFAARQQAAEWRAQERFARVGRYYTLAREWVGLVSGAPGGSGVRFAWPSDDDDSDEQLTLDAAAGRGLRVRRVYRPRMRLGRAMLSGVLAEDRAPAGMADERPAAVAWIRCGANGSDPWVQADRMGQDGYRTSGEIRAVDLSFSLAVQADDAGVILTPHGQGSMPHALLARDWVDSAEWDEKPPLNDTFVVTCVLESDRRVQVGYPPLVDLEGLEADVPRVETIELGDRAHWDYCPEGTVIGTDGSGALRFTDAAQTLRDDRPWMRDLARWVYEWYGRRRQAFQFRFRQVSDLLRRGQLITEIGVGENAQPVRSLVTQVHYDLVRGSTEVSTSFAELDLSLFA